MVGKRYANPRYSINSKWKVFYFDVVITIQTEQGWVDVGRFDTAHGIPNQDILGQKASLLQKICYDDISPKEVFHLAITTFQKNYELIINAFKKTKLESVIAYISHINPTKATIEEMDAWLLAQGAEVLDSARLNDVVHKISWANVPGENPGDTEFPFASVW